MSYTVREAHMGADAIVALESWEPTSNALTIQERVIADELTHDEAVREHVAQVLVDSPKGCKRPTIGQEEQ